ncbi:D-alanyl-D-alanine carboxypeptidase family protein [Rickettsiales endosymbiont of Stachyamoeba lipophora]|uniref:D-alanyl-D-alanine carboxypeptidase family protein n=1 Tax=Rickettsiales endosymbiont of Stachyamoeba lipophora TaxID=2486578 RepID=UPI000F64CEFD|nr:D-alanyl-D-alanine carboxypeptidase family protein [Rickettsiales endosymbiont of Stachyamoeba lipophora]AZL16303.1 D-alanyl-D-alanine carboxypeptidase [Rickettsiales endosymbiont of Stachyamoeba lipophora]
MKKLFLLSTVFLVCHSLNAQALDTLAKHVVLQDYDTGHVLFEKEADLPMTPSSMSKLMTIYVAFEQIKNGNFNLDHKFLISEKAWRMQGSKMFLPLNDQATMEDLLKGVIVQSGNDASVALAEGIAGSEEVFVDLMNQKAKELGLTNSVFKNSTGWPEEGHIMSAKDLAILSKRVIDDFPEFYQYFGIKEFTFNGIKQQNRNSLLDMSIGVDGLKTGHTEIAGYGVALSAKQNNRRLILVVNGLDTFKDRTNEAYKLLQYGFLNYENVEMFKKHQEVAKIKIEGGAEEQVPVTVAKDVIFTVPKLKKNQIRHEVVAHNVAAPIRRNQVIGKLKVSLPDTAEKIEFNLIAVSDVAEIKWWQSIPKKIKKLLS